MKKCTYVIVFLALIALIYGLFWFSRVTIFSSEKPLHINFSRSAQTDNEPVEDPLRIAVSAMTSPQTTEALYRDLLELIGEHLDKPVAFVQRPTYEEIDDLLKNNRIDLAFVCSGSYALGHDDYGLQLLAIPIIKGQRVYHSDIIVAKDSPLTSLEALRDKRFTFTSKSSNSGCLAPTFLLAQRQETPQTFFASVTYSGTHDKAIHAVAHHICDGAAVDSLILNHMVKEQDPSALNVRVVECSQNFGMPPVVVPPGIAPQLKRDLRDIFLSIHQSEQGRFILDNLGIDFFTLANDSEYDGIREMAQVCIEH